MSRFFSGARTKSRDKVVVLLICLRIITYQLVYKKKTICSKSRNLNFKLNLNEIENCETKWMKCNRGKKEKKLNKRANNMVLASGHDQFEPNPNTLNWFMLNIVLELIWFLFFFSFVVNCLHWIICFEFFASQIRSTPQTISLFGTIQFQSKIKITFAST